MKRRLEQEQANVPACQDEQGQTIVEYALILALVSVMGLALTPIGPWLVAQFTNVSAAL